MPSRPRRHSAGMELEVREPSSLQHEALSAEPRPRRIVFIVLQMEDGGATHGSAASTGARLELAAGAGGCAVAAALSTPVQWVPQAAAQGAGSFGRSRCRRRPDHDAAVDDDDDDDRGGDVRARRARSSATRMVAPEVTTWRLMNAQRGQVGTGGVANTAPQQTEAETDQEVLEAAARAAGQTRLTQFFRAQHVVGGGALEGLAVSEDDAMVE